MTMTVLRLEQYGPVTRLFHTFTILDFTIIPCVAVESRLRKTTHKYGIEIPYSVEEAYVIDNKNGNSLWGDTLGLKCTT